MADISKITLPSGQSYDLKDATARSQIQNIQTSITGAMHYVGTTTTALTDGSTTATITIDGDSMTLAAADAGAVAIYGQKEYVWNGSKWQEFGSTGSLKALAFKDNASATYTPAGSVSQPTFTGTSMTSTGTYTPAGSISTTTKSTTNKTATVSVAASGTTTYQPGGIVSTPTITVTPSTTTVNSITAVGSLPSWTGVVADETLTIGWSAGTLPTKGSDTTVVDGITSATSTQPDFTGTAVRLVTGNIAVPSAYTSTWTGTEDNISVTGTPTGSVSQPTFSGTETTITVS